MRASLRLVCARLTLAVFLAGLGLPLVSTSHLRWDDDVDCGSGVLAPHQAVRRVSGEAAPAPAAQHCALCHWLRAVASAAPVPVIEPLPGFIAARQAPNAKAVQPALGASTLPGGRAPPLPQLS
jgi:hypothetical protein